MGKIDLRLEVELLKRMVVQHDRIIRRLVFLVIAIVVAIILIESELGI